MKVWMGLITVVQSMAPRWTAGRWEAALCLNRASAPLQDAAANVAQ
jgi:hypothetical protein